MLMMSFFDLYNSAFRSVQSRALFVAEAGVKIFDPPNLALPFQEHKDNTRVQFDEFAAYVKTHSLDTTEKLLVQMLAFKRSIPCRFVAFSRLLHFFLRMLAVFNNT
jgi:hypothetical protein